MPPPTARGAQLTVPTSAEMDMAQHVGAGTAQTRPQTPTSRAGGVVRGRKIFFPAQCSARVRAGAAGAARAAPQSGKTRVGIWPLAAPVNRAFSQKFSKGGPRLFFKKNMFFPKAKNADPFTFWNFAWDLCRACVELVRGLCGTCVGLVWGLCGACVGTCPHLSGTWGCALCKTCVKLV